MAEQRLDAGGRIQRLLAILRHAAASPEGVLVDDLCAKFKLRKDQLIRELNMAAMIGGHSANYEDMPFEVILEGDEVFVRLFSLDRPLRLTPGEGVALVAAADALAAGDPDPNSALRRGLAKVAAVLGIDPEDTIDVDLRLLGGPAGQLVDTAIRAGTRVRFRYWSYGTDEVSVRVVEPWQVFQAEGAWYVVGHDLDRGGARRFRVDRMTDVEVLSDPATVAPEPEQDTIDLTRTPRATLVVPGHARWVAESFPVDEAVERPDGRLEVTLPVAGRSWLERLVLRIGDVEILALDPSLGDTAVAAGAARRILDRYAPQPSTDGPLGSVK